MAEPSLKLVELQSHNFREVVPTLRAIADQIETGKWGEIGCCGIVLLGDTMEVFGMGPDSEGPSVAVLLHSGFLRLSKAIEEHGR